MSRTGLQQGLPGNPSSESEDPILLSSLLSEGEGDGGECGQLLLRLHPQDTG